MAKRRQDYHRTSPREGLLQSQGCQLADDTDIVASLRVSVIGLLPFIPCATAMGPSCPIRYGYQSYGLGLSSPQRVTARVFNRERGLLPIARTYSASADNNDHPRRSREGPFVKPLSHAPMVTPTMEGTKIRENHEHVHGTLRTRKQRGRFQPQNAGERPEFGSQTTLRLTNPPELRGFLSTRKPRRFAGTVWWGMQESN